MQVIETTVHVGSDGMLRLEVPLEQRDQDVRVAVVVESAPAGIVRSSPADLSRGSDPWAPYRTKLESAGFRVPAPDSWSARQGEPLRYDGPQVSETLVEDRR